MEHLHEHLWEALVERDRRPDIAQRHRTERNARGSDGPVGAREIAAHRGYTARARVAGVWGSARLTFAFR